MNVQTTEHFRPLAAHRTAMPSRWRHNRGFSAPLLLLALVAAALTWAVTLDRVQNTAVQARVSEAEATAITVMEVLQQHCVQPRATLAQQPYRYADAPDAYIADLRIDGSCAAPELHIAMRHTAALPVEPVFVFSGQWAGDSLLWSCRETAGTGAVFIPDGCR